MHREAIDVVHESGSVCLREERSFNWGHAVYLIGGYYRITESDGGQFLLDALLGFLVVVASGLRPL